MRVVLQSTDTRWGVATNASVVHGDICAGCLTSVGVSDVVHAANWYMNCRTDARWSQSALTLVSNRHVSASGGTRIAVCHVVYATLGVVLQSADTRDSAYSWVSNQNTLASCLTWVVVGNVVDSALGIVFIGEGTRQVAQAADAHVSDGCVCTPGSAFIGVGLAIITTLEIDFNEAFISLFNNLT